MTDTPEATEDTVLGDLAPLVQAPWGAALLGLVLVLVVVAAALRERTVGPDGVADSAEAGSRWTGRLVSSLLVLAFLALAVATLIRFATYTH